MIRYTTANTASDLSSILALQKANLIDVLTPEEKKTQGFVTVSHTYDQLKSMNDDERHILAKEGNTVIAYLLAMTKRATTLIPALHPMFEMFEETKYGERSISNFNYIVVGQACVDKRFRGLGVLDKCYETYREHFRARYDFAITEIAIANSRSQAAHRRIGFREIARYIAPDNIEWSIVVWDWRTTHELNV